MVGPEEATVRQLVVGQADRGGRLDRFIQGSLATDPAAPTRAEVQRWIAAGEVRLNARIARASDTLRPGDVVQVSPAPPRRSTAAAEEGIRFDVVFADDAVLVVDKPAGLVVHPARSHPGGTLVNGLLARGYFALPTAPGDGGTGLSDPRDPEGHLRPGIVHRIDKGTSGLLVIARTAASREALKAQLAAHTVLREYEAIAVGDVRLLVHDTLHGRHPGDRLRFTTRLTEGRRAVTHVEIVERFGVATHVRCRLRTGRTHQIRVHLAESGTPILGDSLYGSTPRQPLLAELARALGHQALHARSLGFVHPTTGETLRFEAPLPPDFAASLERLRRSTTT